MHVLADERDRVLLATTREVMLSAGGAVTTKERLFAPPDRLDTVAGQLAGWYPDVPAGLGVQPLTVDEIGALGPLLCNRGYKQRWPLVGVDLPWTVGRLAAHAGQNGRRDGFSLSLLGCGAVNEAGDWVHSWHRPRLTVSPRGAGLPGAFLGWTSPKEAADRCRGRRPTFVDLGVLSGALSGGDVDGGEQAAQLFDVPWPTATAHPLQRLRKQARALVELYGRLVWALAEVAPGFNPRDCWSFGSIATLRDASVVAPLEKVGSVTDRDLGAAASACFGGRFEARVVGVPMPLVLRDIRSTYASIFGLLGLTSVYACRLLRPVEHDPMSYASCSPTWQPVAIGFAAASPGASSA